MTDRKISINSQEWTHPKTGEARYYIRCDSHLSQGRGDRAWLLRLGIDRPAYMGVCDWEISAVNPSPRVDMRVVADRLLDCIAARMNKDWRECGLDEILKEFG